MVKKFTGTKETLQLLEKSENFRKYRIAMKRIRTFFVIPLFNLMMVFLGIVLLVTLFNFNNTDFNSRLLAFLISYHKLIFDSIPMLLSLVLAILLTVIIGCEAFYNGKYPQLKDWWKNDPWGKPDMKICFECDGNQIFIKANSKLIEYLLTEKVLKTAH